MLLTLDNYITIQTPVSPGIPLYIHPAQDRICATVRHLFEETQVCGMLMPLVFEIDTNIDTILDDITLRISMNLNDYECCPQSALWDEEGKRFITESEAVRSAGADSSEYKVVIERPDREFLITFPHLK